MNHQLYINNNYEITLTKKHTHTYIYIAQLLLIINYTYGGFLK